MALDRVIDLSHEFSYIIFFVREILRSGFRNIFDSLRDIYIYIRFNFFSFLRRN